jgi:hypothetical protein
LLHSGCPFCTLIRCSTFFRGSTARSIRERGDLSSASQKGFSRPRLISHRGGHNQTCPLGAQCVFIILTLLHYYSVSLPTEKKERPFLLSFSSYLSQHNQSFPQSSNSSRLSSTPGRKQTHQRKDTTNCTKTSSKKRDRQNREQTRT